MINDKIICSGTRQQIFQRSLSRGLLRKDPILHQTTVEQWSTPLVTNVQDAGSNPGTWHFLSPVFSARFSKNEMKAASTLSRRRIYPLQI